MGSLARTFFCHGGKASWIRVTDIPFAHGRDDFRLLRTTPQLKDIGALLRSLESAHAIEFKRAHALIRTNLSAAERHIRAWLQAI